MFSKIFTEIKNNKLFILSMIVAFGICIGGYLLDQSSIQLIYYFIFVFILIKIIKKINFPHSINILLVILLYIFSILLSNIKKYYFFVTYDNFLFALICLLTELMFFKIYIKQNIVNYLVKLSYIFIVNILLITFLSLLCFDGCSSNDIMLKYNNFIKYIIKFSHTTIQINIIFLSIVFFKRLYLRIITFSKQN